MSPNLELIQEGVITRRTFLQGSAGAVILIITAGSVGSALSACASPTKDFAVTSSTVNNHSHKITVVGTDVDKPTSEKTYTSDGTSHQHMVTLKKSDLQAIKKGQEVKITSSSAGPIPHAHEFTIKKSAA